ncbi:MAG: lipopolysaccharide biosynthesis protein [Bacteroidaceae bacterium]|nr:lipopolysaccharide biosynthesis protein [Bacteroidaceae bacterium]
MNLKSLLKDTAIYGLSSIVGRFLNYLLVPLYTFKMAATSGGYGVITNIYSWVALCLVVCIFGMETTFFRFANKEGEDPRSVLSNAFWLILTLSLLMLAGVLGFLPSVASSLGYADSPWFVGAMAIVTAFDAVQAILFSWLRFVKRPIKFAAFKLLFIALSISLNLIYYVLLQATDPTPAFFINLVCTLSITLFFIPELRLIRFQIDRRLMRSMLSYSWPILILGIAGILNQTADKLIFPFVADDPEHRLLGIYGAGVKIAMIMAMITQAFRYAYEPLVFSSTRDADAKTKYAVAMNFFVIFTLLAYLCVIGGMPILRHIISPDYWDGLCVVPIVMVAEIMMGIYFNLSFWYKLIDRTIYGAVFSIAGCLVLIAVNVFGIPHFSFMACAWGGVAGYGTAMLLSYVVGQLKNPIPYDIPKLLFYVALTALCHALIAFIPDALHLSPFLSLAFSATLILLFLLIVWHKELRHHLHRS